MEQPVQVLERLLTERGINPDVHGTDIGFLYLPGGHAFKGEAWADTESAAIKLWLYHSSLNVEDEKLLQAKLVKVNEKSAMKDAGVRWMRFVFAHNHLGFFAQLNEREKPFEEGTARLRLDALLKLMESELPNLIA
ncbi:MAG: hypothetical protein WC814_00105 [Candidatus Paceibacterota bacterium]|jgi:hypothetical protein